jgi:hypothetical protein
MFVYMCIFLVQGDSCLLSTPNTFGGGTQEHPKKFNKRWQEITLEAKPAVDCEDVKETLFLWTSQHDSNEIDLTGVASATSSRLIIPAKFLDYGAYKFTFKVGMCT